MISQSRRYLLASLACGVAFGFSAAGCNDDKPALKDPTDGQDSGYSDVSMADTGTGDASSPPPDSGPEGPQFASVVIKLDPPIHVYRSAVRVKTSATVLDSDGNEVEDAALYWKVEPEGAAKKTGGRWKFEQEGEVTFVACAENSEWKRKVCGRKTVLVDEGPPKLEITEPEAGAQLGQGGTKKVTVSGKASDSNGQVHVFVDGERVQLESDGSFTTEITPEFGVNHLTVSASDGINPSDRTREREFVWAGHWKDVTSEMGSVSYTYDDGLALDLGQNFFDDTKPPVRKSMEKKLVTNDFADIIQLLIQTIDISGQLPPRIDTGTGIVKLLNVSLGQPDVEIDVTDEGLDIYVTIGKVDITTGGKLKIDRQDLNMTGNIDARAVAVAQLTLKKGGADKTFSADVKKLDLSIDDLDSHFASEQANAIFDLAESALREKMESILVNALKKEFVATLPKMLTDTLNSLEDSLGTQSFTFESEFTGKRTINFEGAIRSFDTKFRNSIVNVLSTKVAATGMDLFSMAPGIPMMTPVAKKLPLFDQSRIQIGLRLGVLNGLMTTLWKAGFLEIDLSNILPDNFKNVVKKANLSGRMPPVMRPAQRSEPYDLVLEAGQMEMEAEMLQQTDTYGISVRAGVNITIKDNKLTLDLPDKPEFTTWVIDSTEDEAFFNPDDLRQLIVDNVWPQLQKTLKDGLQLDLPKPDLAGLSNLSPSLSNLTLSFELARPLVTRQGYIVFDTVMKGELPIGGMP